MGGWANYIHVRREDNIIVILMVSIQDLFSHISPFTHTACGIHIAYKKGVCAEQTKQTVDSCFGLVGPHQRHLCLATLQQSRLTYMYATFGPYLNNHMCIAYGTYMEKGVRRANQANGEQLFRAG